MLQVYKPEYLGEGLEHHPLVDELDKTPGGEEMLGRIGGNEGNH